MKKLKSVVTAALAAVICFQCTVFADSGGDPNIDNGGGNLLEGSQGNFWNPGNDGVRITVVNSETGAVKSACACGIFLCQAGACIFRLPQIGAF